MTPPAAVAAPATRPRRTSAPARPLAPRPRRVSGPSRPARPTRPARPARSARPARREHVLAGLLHRLPRGRALDRLLRGRAAIGLVAFALIGIVTLQLGLLKLNAGIGRTLQRQATLQRADAQLSIEDSELAAGERVQARAAAEGMKLAPVRALRFLHSGGPGDAARAAAALKPPSPTASAPWSEGEGASGGEASSAAPASESHTAASPSEEATHEKAAEPGSGTTGVPPAAGTTAPSSSSSSSSEASAASSGEASSSGKEAPSSSAAQSGGSQAAPGG